MFKAGIDAGGTLADCFGLNDKTGSVAVVFLSSHKNPVHEFKAKEVLERELPGIPVTTSFETSPKIRWVVLLRRRLGRFCFL